MVNNIESTSPEHTGLNRRRVVAGAAWAIPVVATALAAPAAAASLVGRPSLAFTGNSTSRLTLALLDGTGTLTARTSVRVPTQLTLSADPAAGAITNQSATVTVTVGRPSGINISVGQARGFGVASFNGQASTSTQRTVSYQTNTLGTRFGFPTTTYTTRQVFNVPAAGGIVLPLQFGLAGSQTGININAVTTFPVTVSLLFDTGVTATSTGEISVPVGAGIL
jgi:hypothetical protein